MTDKDATTQAAETVRDALTRLGYASGRNYTLRLLDELDVLVAALQQAEQERDYFGAALARIGEMNPAFESEGKGAWQTRAVRAEEALADAIWAADFLKEQQAIPDSGYVERLERARAVLAGGGGNTGETPDQ